MPFFLPNMFVPGEVEEASNSFSFLQPCTDTTKETKKPAINNTKNALAETIDFFIMVVFLSELYKLKNLLALSANGLQEAFRS